ncbi:hypothetical protein LTR70_003808 [Exophiala xenobiotica]|uniref:Uncharacterized protein n=1 Tax=Lithohypha guttulata TaxID=1690604 RepID=A0ABR0KFE6_9EURO|nr:hypothetical protein LTR24_003325 [Lithohypha guttulata]KAK5322306.1 hypothetical protein LTR70_003808 [Exophiala xenobiotica]
MASKSNHSPSPSHSPSSSTPSKPTTTKPKHLDIPSPTPTLGGATRTTPGQLLPATALFHGPNSRNASNLSLNRHTRDRDRDDKDKSTGTPGDQHLPRARPPTSSFSGASHPSITTNQMLTRSSHKKPPNNLGGGALSSLASKSTQKHDDEFRADAVWAEMQKTLADVELSAMNSSHVFSREHVGALEDLRGAQLGLAMAWARSEAEEGVDEEFGRDDQGGGGGAVGGGGIGDEKGGVFGGKEGAGASLKTERARGGNNRSRQGSTASNRGENMEEETERDIRLARKRREANDRYFKQVNTGVVGVVKRLDEVVEAMRRVEKESREIWNSSESGGGGGSGSGSGSGNDSEDLGPQTGTDEGVRRKRGGDGNGNGDAEGRKRAGTADTDTAGTTESEVLSDSPVQTNERTATSHVDS